jgi:hypothetical protein
MPFEASNMLFDLSNGPIEASISLIDLSIMNFEASIWPIDLSIVTFEASNSPIEASNGPFDLLIYTFFGGRSRAWGSSWKPWWLWLPSQNGLFWDAPQRQSETTVRPPRP